jgi:hypothetical protein
MTITRKYSLPNCTLVLEGLSDNPGDSGSTTGLMSILVNAECHFLGSKQLLSGGRVFFESLVKAVNAYAQGFLSGLNHPLSASENAAIVHLEKIGDRNFHRLTVEPEPNSNGERKEIELTTVQLFDLVEAIDQFVADSRTLPDLNPNLQPLSRRYRQAEEPLVQRATPVALGVVGLAACAFAFSLIPPPEIRKSEPKPQSNPSQTLPRSTPSTTETAPPSTTPSNNPNPNNAPAPTEIPVTPSGK